MDNNLRQKYDELITQTIKGEDTSSTIADILNAKQTSAISDANVPAGLSDYVKTSKANVVAAE